jgi:hypothetical protein
VAPAETGKIRTCIQTALDVDSDEPTALGRQGQSSFFFSYASFHGDFHLSCATRKIRENDRQNYHFVVNRFAIDPDGSVQANAPPLPGFQAHRCLCKSLLHSVKKLQAAEMPCFLATITVGFSVRSTIAASSA